MGGDDEQRAVGSVAGRTWVGRWIRLNQDWAGEMTDTKPILRGAAEPSADRQAPARREDSSARAGAKLRRQAEEMARAEAEQTQESSEGLSAEAARRLRHELRVLEIELELQKEELKTAERARAESARRALSLTELSPVGIFRTDTRGATTYVNRKWCELSGLSADEALGNGWLGAVHPDDRELLRQGWEDASRRLGASRTEYRIVRPDGSIVWVMGQATPERNIGGLVIGYIGTIVDITERKQSELRLRAVLDATPFPIALVDPEDNEIDFWSSSALTLFGHVASTAPEWYEKAYPDPHYRREVISRWKPAVEKARSSGLSVNAGEYRVTCRDGSVRVCELHATLLAKGLVVTFNDITQRKRAEEALTHSQAQLLQSQKLEAVGRLAGGVAHDFNNILQALLSLATVLRLKVATPELAKVAGEIEAHITRGAGLTQQLLLFSRRQTAEKKKLDLGELTSAVGGLLRRLIPENIRLAIDTPAERLWVEGDAGQLQQVLVNLAVNARDAMPGGGTLTVRTSSKSDEAVLEVADTGHGMDEATRAHLFEPFFSTKESEKGTGLGLSVVHGIVELHGGRVEVETAPGKGSCFRVILPAAAAPDDAAVGAGGQADLPGGRGERVLLVEDEPGVREGLTELLQILGYEVIAVGSGEEAGAVANEPAPDLLLTDLMLPGIDGAELAEQLRGRWPGLSVVLMSGYTEDEAVRRGIDEGSVRFLQKPFDMAALARAVSAALAEPARREAGSSVHQPPSS